MVYFGLLAELNPTDEAEAAEGDFAVFLSDAPAESVAVSEVAKTAGDATKGLRFGSAAVLMQQLIGTTSRRCDGKRDLGFRKPPAPTVKNRQDF